MIQADEFSILSSEVSKYYRIDPLGLTRYCLYQPEWASADFGPGKAKLIKQNDLSALLFQEGDFLASMEPHIISLDCRGLYWAKTGRIFYSIKVGGKTDIELGISYLDPKIKSPLRLINMTNPRYSNGGMVKLLPPLSIGELGTASNVAPKAIRGLVKSIEFAHLREITEELRKLLYKIVLKKVIILKKIWLTYTNIFQAICFRLKSYIIHLKSRGAKSLWILMLKTLIKINRKSPLGILNIL